MSSTQLMSPFSFLYSHKLSIGKTSHKVTAIISYLQLLPCGINHYLSMIHHWPVLWYQPVAAMRVCPGYQNKQFAAKYLSVHALSMPSSITVSNH